MPGIWPTREARGAARGEDRGEAFNPLPVRIQTPINVDVLARYLDYYPCQGTRDYLVEGFRNGFDIGFRGSFTDDNSRPRNLRSGLDNAQLVGEAILKIGNVRLTDRECQAAYGH